MGGAFEYDDLYGNDNKPTQTLNSIHQRLQVKIEEILKNHQEPKEPTIIILPELYGSPELDDFIDKKLESHTGNIVIIAGSYYVEEGSRKRNRATILGKIGKTLFKETQYKRLYSPEEKALLKVTDDTEKPQMIFTNTGFGDFSVIICSDLDSRQQPDLDTILDKLAGKIDIAFVIAFNKGVGPHERACKKAGDVYNYLIYVNGRKHDLAVEDTGCLRNQLFMYYPFAGEEHEEAKEMNGEQGLYRGEIEFDVRYLEFAKLKIIPILKTMQEKGIISKPWKTPVTEINPRHFSLVTSLKDNRSFELVSNGKVLAIGSHWDDILLGCLGTLIKLRLLYNYEVTLITLCNSYNNKYYGNEQDNLVNHIKTIYGKFVADPYQFKVVHTESVDAIMDRKFNSSGIIGDKIQGYSSDYGDYNLILCPPADDEHEDHAIAGRLVRSSFRNAYQTVLEYEIKKYTEDLFVPNVFINLDENVANAKVDLLQGISTLIKGSGRLFSRESLRARLIVNANSYSKGGDCKYGEIFRGRIQL